MNDATSTEDFAVGAYVLDPLIAQESAYLVVFVLIIALFFFIFRMKKGGD
ncbi:MAG: hypothetical protein ACLFQJ_08765 [Campylobacterales bacterium]